MFKYRNKFNSVARKPNNLATFSRASRRSNFNAATAEPEVEQEEGKSDDEGEGYDEEITPEEEEEGLAILEDLIESGDEEALLDILEAFEDDLIAQVEERILSEEEASYLLEEQIAALEEALGLEADYDEIPEEEYYAAEYDADDGEYDDGEYDDDEEALIEEEGIALLEQLEPEALEEIYEAATEELEADLDEIDALYEAGELDDDEAEELYAEVEEQHEANTADYEAYLDYALGEEGEEGEDEYYYEEDPLVDHVEALTQEVEFQRRQTAQIQAEFSHAQTAHDVNDQLNYLEGVASDLVQQGIMPFAVFQREFGEWENESDRMAGFSQVCSANGTSSEIELAQKERTLEMFLEMAESGVPLYSPENFSNMAEFSEEELTEIDNLAVQSRRNVLHLLGVG